MECDEVQNRLLDYRDAQLDVECRTRLEAHLLICSACLTALRDLETLLAAVAGLPAADPSPAFARRLRDRVRAERGRRRARWWDWPPATPAWAAAAALVVLAAGAAAWMVPARAPAPEVRVEHGARATGQELERSLAALTRSADGPEVDYAVGLWRTALPAPSAIDVLVGLTELSDRELEDVLARVRG